MNVLERHVLETIGESTSSPDVFLDTDAGIEPIRDSINDAIQEIAMLSGGYKEVYRISLRADQTFYRFKFRKGYFAWISDCWLIGSQWRMKQTDVTKLNSIDPRWFTHTGSPESYWQIGVNAMGIYPRPAADGKIIELTCVAIPDRYTSEDDRIKLRTSFKWAVVHYAVSEYYASRGDANEAILHHNKYFEQLGLRDKYPQATEKVYRAKTHDMASPTQTN